MEGVQLKIFQKSSFFGPIFSKNTVFRVGGGAHVGKMSKKWSFLDKKNVIFLDFLKNKSGDPYVFSGLQPLHPHPLSPEMILNPYPNYESVSVSVSKT